jgi:hypothetical protein
MVSGALSQISHLLYDIVHRVIQKKEKKRKINTSIIIGKTTIQL